MKKINKGGYLSELRKKKNLTQKDLGDLIHYSDKNISKWEMNKSFPEDEKTLSALAEALGVTVKDLRRGGHKPFYETIFFKGLIALIVLAAVLIAAIMFFSRTSVYIIKADNKDVYIENGNYIINHNYVNLSINNVDTNKNSEIESIELFKYNGSNKKTMIHKTSSFPINIYERKNRKSLIGNLAKNQIVLKIFYKDNTEQDIKLSLKRVDSKFVNQENYKNKTPDEDATTTEEYLSKIGFVKEYNTYVKQIDENVTLLFNNKSYLKLEIILENYKNAYVYSIKSQHINLDKSELKSGAITKKELAVSKYKPKDCYKEKCSTEQDYIGYLIFLKDKINSYEKNM